MGTTISVSTLGMLFSPNPRAIVLQKRTQLHQHALSASCTRRSGSLNQGGARAHPWEATIEANPWAAGWLALRSILPPSSLFFLICGPAPRTDVQGGFLGSMNEFMGSRNLFLILQLEK